MNVRLKQDKQTIREYIRNYFDDQRLAQVYAFNRDGKMEFYSRCGCLLGVTLCTTLHYKACDEDRMLSTNHYFHARNDLKGAKLAEMAYGDLCSDYSYPYGKLLRQQRLSAILRAEMRRRDRIRASKMVESQDNAVVLA